MNSFQFVLNILDSDAVLGQEVVILQILVGDIVDNILKVGVGAQASGYAVTYIDVELIYSLFQIGNIVLDVDDSSAILGKIILGLQEFVGDIVDSSSAIFGQIVVFFQIVLRNIGDGTGQSSVTIFQASGYAVAYIDVEFIYSLFQIGNIVLDVDDSGAVLGQEVVC